VTPATRSVEASDGHRFEQIEFRPEAPAHYLYWLPALGVTARSYRPFARALAEKGVAVIIHEWRGAGSSSLRAGRRSDWGYRELLDLDIAAGLQQVGQREPGQRLLIGGHSLGAQIAALALARQPDSIDGLVIIAGGSPWWRSFPFPLNGLLPLVFVTFRGLGAVLGYYPGRRLGFAGTEARGLIRDWTRSGWTGHYNPDGIDQDLEAAMSQLEKPVLTLSMASDWFVPRGSLEWLLGKMPGCTVDSEILGQEDFAERKPDHFGWMKEPGPVVERIVNWPACKPPAAD